MKARLLHKAWVSARTLMHRATLPLQGRSARGIHIIIFSRDRALQLELLLRSMSQHVRGASAISVMYSCSSEAHRASYHDLAKSYVKLGANFVEEGAFRASLIDLLRRVRYSHVTFLVDDICFLEDVDYADLAPVLTPGVVASLRLGRGISRSIANKKDAPEPAFGERMTPQGRKLLSWKWREGKGVWGFSTSVDGNIFPRLTLLAMTLGTRFRAPNSFEHAIGELRYWFRGNAGLCFERPCIVNFPLNSVKTEDFNFKSLDLDPDEFLDMFSQGQRLDIENFPKDEHNSTHMFWMPSIRRPEKAGPGE